jgi:histidinol-phosphate aminotransferase
MEGIRAAVEKEKPRLLFLANPNNPDGSVITEDIFRQLVDLPLLLVVDEAYIQFTDQGRTVIDEVAERRNLIVLRTFSKWAGLAGLRIGYGVFPMELVPLIMKAKQPYNVSLTAACAAAATMRNIDKTKVNIERIIEQREVLYTELQKISWLQVYPSQTNFILCKVDGLEMDSVKEFLQKEGIFVRYYDKPGFKDHMRIGIGTPQQVQSLLRVLKGIR